MGHGANPKLLAAELEHLRHEWHASDPSVLSQRGENFLFAPNFYEISGAETGQAPTHGVPQAPLLCPV
jgi:hypothetical protein